MKHGLWNYRSYMSSWIIYVKLNSYIFFFFFFFSNRKNRRSCAEKTTSHIKERETKGEEKKNFWRRAETPRRVWKQVYESWNDNRLLKQSLRQFRNQSLVRRSCTNSRIYSTIMSICKDKKSAAIAKFRKALPSFT